MCSSDLIATEDKKYRKNFQTFLNQRGWEDELIGATPPPAVTNEQPYAAGAMLYVVVEELVPQAHSKTGTCGFVGGFLIMMILDVALG